MFTVVAAIAFVGCVSETKPAEEVIEESLVIEYTVDGVAADLLNCADEAEAIKLLDGIKANAQYLLDNGDQEGYFYIINILRTVLENNQATLLAKIPTLADKITAYTEVPDSLKAGFSEFVAKQAAEKVGNAVEAAADAADAADAAAEKVGDAVDAAKDAVGNAVDAALPKRLPHDSITGD